MNAQSLFTHKHHRNVPTTEQRLSMCLFTCPVLASWHRHTSSHLAFVAMSTAGCGSGHSQLRTLGKDQAELQASLAVILSQVLQIPLKTELEGFFPGLQKLTLSGFSN